MMFTSVHALSLSLAFLKTVQMTDVPRSPLTSPRPDIRATVSSWAPEGAPPPLPGQGLSDYLEKILGGVGKARNEPSTIIARVANDGSHNKTFQWKDGPSRLSITVVGDSCPSGVKPNSVVGNCLAEDKTTVGKDCTVKDIIGRLWTIRQAYPTSLRAREEAFAMLWNTWAAKVRRDWSNLLQSGWICPGGLAPDELSNLGSLRNYTYYSALLLGSVTTGSIVASLEYGIVKSSTKLSLGWVPWVNTAVGSAILVFAAVELSRMRGGEAFAGLAFLGWADANREISEEELERLIDSEENSSSSSRPGSIELTRCVPEEQVRMAASNLANMGSTSQDSRSSRTALGIQSRGDTVIQIERESGECG